MGTRSLEGIREEAQQQITELFLEIVGEDEQEIVHNLLPGMPYIEKRETNQLKSELRKAIND